MGNIPQNARRLKIYPYLVAGPWPQALPAACGVSLSGGFAGINSATSGLVAPLSVDPGGGVVSRWVADPAKFVDNGDGTTSWHPSAGSDLTPVWKFNNPNLPAVQSDYSYKRYRGDVVVTPAVVFTGNQWARLTGFPSNLQNFAVLIVARLIRTHKKASGAILDSVVQGGDINSRKADVFCRLDGDYLKSGCLGRHVNQWIHQTGRPQMIAVTHYAYSSRQHLVDERRHHAEYRHRHNTWGYDTAMNLGAPGGAYDVDRTIHMDLLEIVMWDTAVGLTAMNNALHTLNGVYGIAK